MSILVVGGTGTVGSQTVRRLIEKGVTPRVMTHSPEKVAKLPTDVKGVVGDTGRPETLPAAMKGVEKLVLITALSPTEEEQGKNAVRAAKEAGVRRVVYVSIHNVESIPEAPHFKSKIEIQKAIEASGLAWTLIMPSNFFQNEVWFRAAIMEYGVYPQPLGQVGLHRVDTRDIADAIVNAVTQPGHEGRRYPLVGPDLMTGPGTAAALSKALGREIKYGGDDLDAWAAQAKQMLPDWLVADFVIMFRAFQKNGLKATDADFAQQAKVLGHPPRRYSDYAAELARAWKG